MRRSARSSGRLYAYSSPSARNGSSCLAFIFAAGSPEGLPCSAAFLLAAVRISLYAFGSTTAILLWLIQRMNHLEAQVVLAGQRPQSLARPLPHLRWVGAEEAWSIHRLTVRHRVVLAQVMSLHAPSPGSRIGRRAEHCDMILLWIAALAAVVLQHLQHVFQAHDGNGFDVAGLAQP